MISIIMPAGMNNRTARNLLYCWTWQFHGCTFFRQADAGEGVMVKTSYEKSGTRFLDEMAKAGCVGQVDTVAAVFGVSDTLVRIMVHVTDQNLMTAYLISTLGMLCGTRLAGVWMPPSETRELLRDLITQATTALDNL